MIVTENFKVGERNFIGLVMGVVLTCVCAAGRDDR